MKMQKVEVEIPIFDGWEFYKLAKINDLAVYEIDLAVLCDQMLISADFIHSKNIEVAIYKKKKPRQIIYQEVKEDYLPLFVLLKDFGRSRRIIHFISHDSREVVAGLLNKVFYQKILLPFSYRIS